MIKKLYNNFLELPEKTFNTILWIICGIALFTVIFVRTRLDRYNYHMYLQNTVPRISSTSFIFIILPSEDTEPELTIKEEEVPNVKESQIACRELPAPDHSSFKSYMDAVAIRNKRSTQYRLKSKYSLDSETGIYIYMVDDRYCVALGSYYTTEIGTKVDVILDSGNIIPCILADCKSDAHTDATCRQNPNGSVVEFIVRTKFLSRKVRRTGDCSYAKENWGGNVTGIIVYDE